MLNGAPSNGSSGVITPLKERHAVGAVEAAVVAHVGALALAVGASHFGKRMANALKAIVLIVTSLAAKEFMATAPIAIDHARNTQPESAYIVTSHVANVLIVIALTVSVHAATDPVPTSRKARDGVNGHQVIA